MMSIRNVIGKYYVAMSCLLAGLGAYFIFGGIENKTHTPRASDFAVSYWQFDSLSIAVGVAFVVAALGTFISGVKRG